MGFLPPRGAREILNLHDSNYYRLLTKDGSANFRLLVESEKKIKKKTHTHYENVATVTSLNHISHLTSRSAIHIAALPWNSWKNIKDYN